MFTFELGISFCCDDCFYCRPQRPFAGHPISEYKSFGHCREVNTFPEINWGTTITHVGDFHHPAWVFSFNEANSDFAINDLRSQIGTLCDKYDVNIDIFFYLLNQVYNYKTVSINDFISDLNITREQGISQLKRMGSVCKELDIPNVSIACFNKNNMPYCFIFNDLDDCNTIEERRAYFLYAYNTLVKFVRSFPISILFSKPQDTNC